MRRVTITAVLVSAVALSGCNNQHNTIVPLNPISEAPVGNYTTIDTTDRWTLERSDDQPCVRLRVRDRVSLCVGAIAGGMTTIGTFGGGSDPRFVLAVFGTPNATVRYYSDRQDGTPAAVTAVTDATIAVVELADNEHPWGFQVLSSDGNLIQANSLLG